MKFKKPSKLRSTNPKLLILRGGVSKIINPGKTDHTHTEDYRVDHHHTCLRCLHNILSYT